MTSTPEFDDAGRVTALRALAILDTAPEQRFERLTRLACALFGAPIALVSLVDSERQWSKSRIGFEVQQIPRACSFCSHAVELGDMLVVPDATRDPRFAANPLVTGEPQIRFYAGQPVFSPGGHAVGTLCIIDRVARAFDAAQRQHLRDLASLAEDELNRDAVFRTRLREQQLKTMALTDALTGLHSRRGYELLFESAIRRAHRNGERLALMYLDIDAFKLVNDKLGHAAGDEVLKEFARRLAGAVRKTDTACRLGGNAFAIVLEGVHTLDQCETIGHTILEAIRVPFALGGGQWPVTASIGIAWSAGGESGARRLGDTADAALAQAKAAGCDRFAVRAQPE